MHDSRMGVCPKTSSPPKCVFSFVALVVGLLPIPAGADLVRGYHIGNSLTWSAVSPGLSTVFQSVGATADIGHHIRCGSPLENIVADPTVLCVPAPAPFGNWHTAMSQYTWDYVTLQTHAGMADAEIQAAVDVMTTATQGGRNGQTRFFVYSAWPTQSATQTYREVRTQALTTTALNTNAFLGLLYNQLGATLPMADLGYIPAGEVLLELDDLLRTAPVAGLTSTWDLYSDLYHLNDSGRYVAHATMASVLTGARPQDLAFSSLFNSVDPAFKALANEAIVDVISSDVRVMPLPEPRSRFTVALVVGAMCLLSRRLRSPGQLRHAQLQPAASEMTLDCNWA